MNILYKFSWSINGWIKFCSDVDVENFDDFNGNLLYVVKGLIPLLSAFCHEISSHMSGVNDKCRSLLTPLKIGIIEGLRHKLSELENCIHNNARFSKDLHYCLVNVTLLCGGSIEQPKTKEFRPTCILPPVARENDANINFQMYIKRYLQAYSKSHDNSKSQDAEYICKSIAFPSGPSFNKLIQLFSDSDEDLRNSGNLKIKKLVKFLDIHINKQNRQGIRSLERASLERITLLTLQLICGVVFERISKVSEVLRPKDFQRQYTDTIHPIQEVLLDERIVEILFLLLIHPKDEIPFQVLACLNVLLYPGNEEAKKKISLLVNHQINHELFYVVHQLLRKAQSFLNWKNIQNVLAQILITEPDAPAGFQPVQRARKLASVPVINKWSRSGLFRQPSAELQKKEKNTVMVASIQTISQQTELDMLLQQQEEITNVEDFEEKFDFRQIILGLNVLSWLCDGQQKEIQDILRQKKMLTVGINIVSQVTFFLHGILSDKHLIENNLVVLQSALQSLIEMCAGNYNNQLIAFKGQVIRSINKIVQLETIANDKIYKLKSSSIELLEIMLEETNENSNQLAQWIINYLNIIDLLNVMFQLWENQPKWFSSELDHEKWRNRLFRAYHILRRVADYKNVTVDFLVDYKKHSNECKFAQHFDSHKDEAGKMWQYCHIWSKSIEVVYKGAQNETGILTRVYFHCNPHKNLNEIEKNTVLTHIKRNTPQEKLYDLLKWIQALRDTYTWRKKVKKHWLPHMLLKATVVRQFITSLLIIILNLFVLFGLEAPPTSSTQIGGSCTGDNSTEFQCNDTNTSTTLLYFQPIIVPSSPFWYDPLIYSVGSIHLLFAIWMITQYFIKHWCDISFDIPIFKRIIYNTKKGLLRRKYILSFFKYLNKIFCCGHIRARRPQPEKYFQLFFFSFEPLYRLLFVLFSALGLVSSGYFYCGCIIYLFLRNQVLLYILKAVKKSAIQLITVFVLGFVITYIYAVFSFAIMSNYFDPQRDMFCNTLFQCFVTISRLGFLETLGIDIPVRPSVSHPPSFGVLGFRIIYDLVFFIVVTIIGLNIVVAILVDKFSEIRDDRDKIDVDNQTRCFICSIKKDEFETNGKSFLKHYHNDHHLWNYFNFIVYLDKIHPNDRNALEKYIFSQVPSKNNPTGSIDFFPLFKAKILEKNAVENAFESDDDYDE